ncbi:MAG: hypothetical protein AB7J46_06565 [Candidatus Altimarinota bacterium]
MVNPEKQEHLEKARRQIQWLTEITHNDNKRWWKDLETGQPKQRSVPEMIALMHSELSEMLEADRKDLMDDKLPHRSGLEVEAADLFIRLLDFCGGLGLDIAGAYVEKTIYNANRVDHTREHRLSANGKKY